MNAAAPDSADPSAAQRRAAAAVLDAGALAYIDGGSGHEETLRANLSAWRRLALQPRVLRDMTVVDTSTTLLGAPVAGPVALAPTAMHLLADPEGEAATARAAERTGTLLVASQAANRSWAEIADAAPGSLRWTQMYMLRDRGVTRELAAYARESGSRAIVLCVDGVALPRRSRMDGHAFVPPDGMAFPNLAPPSATGRGAELGAAVAAFDPAVTFDDLALVKEWSGLPLVVKGVLHARDAVECVDAGADAVAVSNHGGRQLDGCVATADVLAEIADAVGARAEVYVDGGIRTGPDVVKALALGARAAFVGRPALWALAAGGTAGLAAYLGELHDDVRRTLAFCGCASPDAVRRGHVRPRPAS
ncbi:alpha-hydroxy-acid oxidizing protein [Streptomycetaceae bacterium NBC_01309]